MTTTSEQAHTTGSVRRRWPALVLLCGFVFLALAVLLGTYLNDRIVLLGPLDALHLDVVLADAAVWCVAWFLVGTLMKAARARRMWPFVRDILAVVILFGALALSAIVGVVVGLSVGVDNQIKLDTPKDSPKYIVSTITLGETNLTLYRGNGTVYDRLDLSLPVPDRDTWFAKSYRVETDPSGQSFLIYPQNAGGEARVPLPLD